MPKIGIPVGYQNFLPEKISELEGRASVVGRKTEYKLRFQHQGFELHTWQGNLESLLIKPVAFPVNKVAYGHILGEPDLPGKGCDLGIVGVLESKKGIPVDTHLINCIPSEEE